MSWSLKANWPVASGDEIISAHFEDLRKSFWSLEYGIPWYGKLADVAADEYDSGTTYTHGQTCLFEGYLYKFCPEHRYVADTPPDLVSITGKSPAEDMQWVRTARWGRYTDFSVSHACFVPIWRDYTPTLGVWRKTPAWQYLPAPLNPYTLQTVTRDGYEMIRPAEEVHGYDAIKPVRFMRYFNDPRYGYAGGALKQIISGHLGAVHNYTLSVSRPYRLFDGSPNPDDEDPSEKYDVKMGGYQSYIEWLCQNARWQKKTTESLFFGEEGDEEDWWYLDGSGQPPMVAAMDHIFWRCNESPFELAIKSLGHFDWYLDITTPPQPSAYAGSTPPLTLRLGCWRRMWRYTHYWPVNASLIWPGELGTPPFADDEVIEGTRTFETAQDAHTWWTSETNVTDMIEDVLETLADPENADVIATCTARHLYAERLWHRTVDVEVPDGYTEVYFGSYPEETRETFREQEPDMWRWYEDAYVLQAELVQDMKDVIDSLSLILLPSAATLSFTTYYNRCETASEAEGDFPTFAAARDWDDDGNWSGWTTYGTAGSVGYMGYGDDTGGAGIAAETVIQRTPADAYWKYNKKVYTGFLLTAASPTADFQFYLDEFEDVMILFNLIARGLKYNYTAPTDEEFAVYNIPDVKSDAEVAGFILERNHYDKERHHWVALPFDETRSGWLCRPDSTFDQVWTEPCPAPGVGGSNSYLHATVEVHAQSDICIGITPQLATLTAADLLMDSPPEEE